MTDQTNKMAEEQHIINHGPHFIDEVSPLVKKYCNKEMQISKITELLNEKAKEWEQLKHTPAIPPVDNDFVKGVFQKYPQLHFLYFTDKWQAFMDFTKEYAGLKAGGWVKVDSEKDLPKETVLYEWNRSPETTNELVSTRQSGKYITAFLSDKVWFYKGFAEMCKAVNLRYLSETLLPDGQWTDDDMHAISKQAFDAGKAEMNEQEIAGKAWDACRTFCIEWFACAISPDITETPTTPNRERYLKSIKRIDMKNKQKECSCLFPSRHDGQFYDKKTGKLLPMCTIGCPIHGKKQPSKTGLKQL